MVILTGPVVPPWAGSTLIAVHTPYSLLLIFVYNSIQVNLDIYVSVLTIFCFVNLKFALNYPYYSVQAIKRNCPFIVEIVQYPFVTLCLMLFRENDRNRDFRSFRPMLFCKYPSFVRFSLFLFNGWHSIPILQYYTSYHPLKIVFQKHSK